MTCPLFSIAGCVSFHAKAEEAVMATVAVNAIVLKILIPFTLSLAKAPIPTSLALTLCAR